MNYYKILEVDRDASPEVIEKAYKTLAKKYHPDLQESNMKQESEEKLKLINEAYETLSNPILREKYNASLTQNEISEEDFYKSTQENQNLYSQLSNLKHNTTYNNKENTIPFDKEFQKQEEYQNQYEKQLEYESQMQQAREKAYHDAYIQDLKNRGYKIKYKKTPRDHLKNFIALIITIIILFILWQIPFIHNFFIRLFEENLLLQTIFNLFN